MNVILVARRSDNGHRDRLWEFCRQQWQRLGWPIYEGHHEEGELFSQAIALNRAASAAGRWSNALIVGSDIFIPRISDIKLAVKIGDSATFNRYYHLDEAQTEALLAGEFSEEDLGRPNPNVGISAMLVTRDLWDKVEGLDERFEGWGFEDISFTRSCRTLGVLRHLDGTAYHLWHPPDSQKTQDRSQLVRNQALDQRYQEAEIDPGAMRLMIAERRRQPARSKSPAQQEEREYGTGMVGIIAQENARFSVFGASMTGLEMPQGWSTYWRFGWDLADAQNALIEEMYARDVDWLWLMADDHAFGPDLLMKLLAHDVDLVVPLCLMRNVPYRAVNWVEAPEDPQGFRRINLDDYPDGGLAEIALSGAAGLLVRRSVFDAVPRPWFETGTGITNRVGEDINFSKKARAAGFKMYCDLDSMLGHCSTTVVWPVREPDGWTYAFKMMGDFEITVPPGFQAYADVLGK